MLGWLWALAGLLVGGIAVYTWMARTPTAETRSTTQLTTGWRPREFGLPRVVARDIDDLDLPEGSQVLTSGRVPPGMLSTCHVRHVPSVRCEFALAEDGRRAALFTAGPVTGASVVVTRDDKMLARLQAEWRALEGRAQAYVERVPIAGLAGRTGAVVATEGLVQDVIAYRDRHMIRLEDGGHVIGVLVAKDPSALLEERILVTGPLRRDETGYPVIEAQDIRRVR